MLVRSNVNEKEGLVEVELNAPTGYYDQYTINLVEICSSSSMPNPNTTVLFSKNFTSTDTTLKLTSSTPAPPSPSLHLEFLILNTPETLKSGCQYEMSSHVQRRQVVRSLKFSQLKPNIKLNAFVIRPEPIRSVLYFVKSNSSANVTWQQPNMGVYQSFSLRHYSPRTSNSTSTNEEITPNTWLLVHNLAADRPHLVEIKSCADLKCHVYSEPVRFALELAEKRIISEMTARNVTNSAGLIDTRASLDLSWRVHPESESDVCDLSAIRLEWASSKSTILPIVDVCPDLKCGPVADDTTVNGIECRHELKGLDFNTKYTIRVGLVALSGSYEWPASASLTNIHTGLSIPSISGGAMKTLPSYEVNANIKSHSAISIVEPLLDESAGPVARMRLYLVKLGSLIQQQQQQQQASNRSDDVMMFTLVSTVDQDYLRQVVALSSPCSNLTMLLEPCLLVEQPYERRKVGNRVGGASGGEKIVFIGRLASNENASMIVERTIVSDVTMLHSLYTKK